jgi:phosphate/sulfate permease
VLRVCAGSNDVANSFATSVGSGSLSLKGACFIACFTEFTGAMLLGDHVTKPIKGAAQWAWRGLA